MSPLPSTPTPTPDADPHGTRRLACALTAAPRAAGRPRAPVAPITLMAGLVGALGLPAAAQTAEAPGATSPVEPVVLAPVEVRGARNDATERRDSTASKIVVGRDEIDRFGDSTVGDLLKRLPGVTIGGAPGRGGAIRMRGLGSGYTQILVDGDRVPPGFSIESLSPEQIERIEIYRAPTAETGARAIAGTINIVMREGARQRLNQLRVGAAVENGRVQPRFAWTRSDKLDALQYTVSLTAYAGERVTESRTRTLITPLAGGAPTLDESESERTESRRAGLNLNGRLQHRGDNGETWVLSPIAVLSNGSGSQRTTLERSAGGPAPYASSDARTEGGYSLLRLNAQRNRRVGEAGRMEWRGGLGQARWDGRVQRRFDAPSGRAPSDEHEDTRDTSANLGGKFTRLVADEHLLVAGLELEAGRRRELQGRGDEGTFDASARSRRLAAYGQDEWTLSPQWALHAGLRWEGIVTRGEDNTAGEVRNRSSVWSPLVHAVWKPDPKSRHQVRLGLTRSYRAPQLQSLITQPRVNTDGRPNSATNPDRIGNPSLRPELATGLDLALERHLPGNGLLSANVFHRRISDYMRRTDPRLEAVPWSPTPRWVSRMDNVGQATTQGLELEAKFRASDLWPEAPRVDLRLNASVFRSRVDGVPGPDNRLDQQPDYTANLGADYRWPGTPLTVGGNLNWTPAYDTRTTESSWLSQGRRRVGDLYALWSFNPNLQLRISASNLAPRDYETQSRFADTAGGTRSSASSVTPGDVSWLLRLEMKL